MLREDGNEVGAGVLETLASSMILQLSPRRFPFLVFKGVSG